MKLAIAMAGVLLAWTRPAAACTPWVEGVLAWDFDADLVVLQIWAGRERPPAAGVPPTGFELRRLSTGEELGARDCRLGPPVACEFRAALAHLLPASAKWRQQGMALPRRLRVRESTPAGLRESALETRGAKGRRRLLWLSVTAAADAERLAYALKLYDEQGTDALLGFEIRLRGGNCARTAVRALRVARADLDDPGRAGRQAALMARPRLDERFEHWRTVADLGPIPPAHLVQALEAAERDDHSAFGVTWWRQNTRDLPPAQVEALVKKVKASETLYWTRSKLGL